MVAAYSIFRGKLIRLRVFPSRGIYRRKGGIGRWARWPHHLVAWPEAGPRHPMVWAAPGLPLSQLWNFGFISSNSENISCVAFLKHKIAENRELALWHLVNRLVPKNT
jgi:hypothetical protein